MLSAVRLAQIDRHATFGSRVGRLQQGSHMCHNPPRSRSYIPQVWRCPHMRHNAEIPYHGLAHALLCSGHVFQEPLVAKHIHKRSSDDIVLGRSMSWRIRELREAMRVQMSSRDCGVVFVYSLPVGATSASGALAPSGRPQPFVRAACARPVAHLRGCAGLVLSAAFAGAVPGAFARAPQALLSCAGVASLFAPGASGPPCIPP